MGRRGDLGCTGLSEGSPSEKAVRVPLRDVPERAALRGSGWVPVVRRLSKPRDGTRPGVTPMSAVGSARRGRVRAGAPVVRTVPPGGGVGSGEPWGRGKGLSKSRPFSLPFAVNRKLL